MLSWREFADSRPDLATAGRRLMYEHGLGLGFLATVRQDGGPRVHPICPVLTDEGLYGFIVPGPKLEDLRRDPHHALHSETVPPPRHDDAFYATGSTVWVHDPALRRSLTQQFLAERDLASAWEAFEEQELIEFKLDRCLLTLTQAQDDLPSGHTIWRA